MYPELLTSKIHSSPEIVVSAAGTPKKASWLFYSRSHILVKPFSFLCEPVSLQGTLLRGRRRRPFTRTTANKVSMLAGGSKNWASQLINCHKRTSKKISKLGKKSNGHKLVSSSQKTDSDMEGCWPRTGRHTHQSRVELV